MRPQRAAALAGVVAVVVALGTGELLAGLVAAVPSPLDAVGQVLIPRFPGAITTWAIDTFGTANRAVLLGAIVLVALALGAVAGMAARNGPATPVTLFVAAGILGIVAAQGQPGAGLLAVVAATAIAAASGLAALRWSLVRASEARVHDPSGGDVVSRRTVLGTLGALAAAAVGAGGVGRWALGGGVTVEPVDVALPTPRTTRPPVTAAVDASSQVDGLSPIITPTDRFFRIDTALSVPRVDPEAWRLRITGMVDRPVELTLDELFDAPMDEVDVTIACVSNEVGGDLIGTARWLGTPLADLLDRAGVRPDATQVVGRSVDGWTAGFPTELAFARRDAIVAVGMNGEPLPARHGFPARLIVPGLYGYVSATKWLAEIELTSWEGFDAYWIPRGWAKEGPIKTASRIDVPRARQRVTTGEVTVAGVAWAPTTGIEAVEVQVDDGPFQPATLVEPLADTTWVQWVMAVELAEGEHALTVRAVDGDRRLQPRGPQPPAPDGAEGWHRRVVRVAT